MRTIKATWKNGQIVPDGPVDLPEGAELSILSHENADFGMREEDWDDSPQGIVEWGQWFESREPLVLTQEERKAMKGAHEAQRAYELANFERNMDSVARVWK